jgi:hypothetical protein
MPRGCVFSNIKQRLHACLFSAGSDEGFVRPSAKGQIDRVNDDGFSRAVSPERILSPAESSIQRFSIRATF